MEQFYRIILKLYKKALIDGNITEKEISDLQIMLSQEEAKTEVLGDSSTAAELKQLYNDVLALKLKLF